MPTNSETFADRFHRYEYNKEPNLYINTSTPNKIYVYWLCKTKNYRQWRSLCQPLRKKQTMHNKGSRSKVHLQTNTLSRHPYLSNFVQGISKSQNKPNVVLDKKHFCGNDTGKQSFEPCKPKIKVFGYWRCSPKTKKFIYVKSKEFEANREVWTLETSERQVFKLRNVAVTWNPGICGR